MHPEISASFIIIIIIIIILEDELFQSNTIQILSDNEIIVSKSWQAQQPVDKTNQLH